MLCDPWAILVLRDIMIGNRRHFRELVAGSEEGIATNILASRLKQLVAAGLLSREATRRVTATASFCRPGSGYTPGNSWRGLPRTSENSSSTKFVNKGKGGKAKVLLS